jgi:hypothetical protein
MKSHRFLLFWLFLGLGIRLLFFTGPNEADSVIYSHEAYLIQQGSWSESEGVQGTRLGLTLPIAVSQALLGVNEVALVLPFLLYWVLEMTAFYVLGLRWFGNKRFLAPALWVFWICPLDVFAATDPHADLPMTAWQIAALALLCFPDRGRVIDRGRALLGGMLVGLAYLTKFPGVLILPFLVLFFAGRRQWRTAGWVCAGAAGIFVGESLLHGWLHGDPWHRYHALQGAHPRLVQAYTPHNPWMFAYLRELWNPIASQFPYTVGIGYLLLWSLLWMPWWKVEARFAALWGGVVFLPLNFMPQDMTFQYPAFAHYARTLHPILPVIAFLFASSWNLAGPRGRWVGGVLAILYSLFSMAGMYVLHKDARGWGEVPRRVVRLAEQQVPSQLLVDWRVTLAYRFYAGFEPAFSIRGANGLVPEEIPPGAWVVLDQDWLDYEPSSRHVPPAWMHSPPAHWKPLWTFERPFRASLRRRLLGWLLKERREEPRTIRAVVWKVPD